MPQIYRINITVNFQDVTSRDDVYEVLLAALKDQKTKKGGMVGGNISKDDFYQSTSTSETV